MKHIQITIFVRYERVEHFFHQYLIFDEKYDIGTQVRHNRTAEPMITNCKRDEPSASKWICLRSSVSLDETTNKAVRESSIWQHRVLI